MELSIDTLSQEDELTTLQAAKAQLLSDIGEEATEDTTTFVDNDAALVSEDRVVPTNASQQATRNALSESLLTGETMFTTLPSNKMAFDVSSPEEVVADVQAKTASLLNEGKEANVLESSLAGDSEGVMSALAVDSEEVSPEDTFVSLVAGGGISAEKMTAHSNSLQANNKVHELIARASQDKVWGFDFLASIMGQILLPGHVARIDSEIVANALQDDSINTSIAQEKYFNTLKDYYNSLNVKDRDVFLEELYNNAQESSGTVFDNSHDVEVFFEKFLKYTSSDATLTNIFSAVDLVTYPVAIVASMAKGIAKSGNAVVAKSLANKEIAAKSVAHDILETAGASGVPDSELVNAALKIGKNPYTYDGQALSNAEESIKYELAQQAASRDVETLMQMTGPTGLDAADVARGVTKYNKMYDDAKAPEWQAFSFREADDTGITYRVTAADPHAGGFYTPEHAQKYADRYGMQNTVIEEMDDGLYLLHADYKHKFTIDDGAPLAMDDSVVQHLPGFLQFPIHSLDSQVVTTRVVGVHQEDTARLAFENLWRDSEKGLTAKGSAKVDIMMAKGDSVSKVFTPDELSSYGLSQKEQVSYFKKRTIRDVSHAVHNKALVDRLTFLGAKEVEYVGEAAEGFKVAGSTMTKEEAKAFAASGKQKVASNVMGSEHSIQSLDAAGIEEIYKKGGTLVRGLSSTKIGDNTTDLFIAQAKDLQIKPLTQVLPYRAGEVSRMYTDKYFVSMNFKGMKNGEEAKVFNTMRTSPTRAGAEKFAKGMDKAMTIIRANKALGGKSVSRKVLIAQLSKVVDNPKDLMRMIREGDIPMDAKFTSKFDREVQVGSTEHSDSIVDTLFSTGRLFTSKRSERMKNVFGDNAPIKSPKEAMAQELSYIARFMNTAVWRESQIDKLLKTFDGKIEKLEGATKYENALYGKPMTDMSLKEEKYLEVLRNHLKTQLSVPSDASIKFKKRMDGFASYMEGKGVLGHKVADKALGMAHGSISQGLRTLVFHSYLGMGNLAQLFVQANGAFIAAAISPQYGLQAAKNAVSLRMGVMLDSVGRADTLRVLAKLNSGMEVGLSSADDFIATVELVRRSGVLNSIKSSALHYVKEGAVNLDTHLAAYTGGLGRAIKHTGSQALKAGLIPFDRGEEFARLVAMDIAKREWVKANPGKSFLSRSAINEITGRQEILTLGMSRANTGRMQQGIASIPFQFARYNWNLMESLLGKNFTAGEKARIIAAGTVLYGTEGMGLTWLAEEIFGEQVADMSKEQKIAISEGAMSWALYKSTGAETAIGSRIGWMKYFSDNLKGISRGDLSAVAVMSGPSGSFLTKEMEFVHEVYRIYDVDGVDLGDKSGMFLNEALKTASVGYSNTTKYLHAYWADGWVKNKAGAKVAQLSTLELVLANMGIKSLKEADINKMYELEGSVRDMKMDLTKGLARLWNVYYTAKSNGESGESEYKQIQAYMQSIPSAILEDEVFMSAHRLLTSDSKFDSKLRKIEQHIRDRKINPSLIPSVRGNE